MKINKALNLKRLFLSEYLRAAVRNVSEAVGKVEVHIRNCAVDSWYDWGDAP
tara:strand:+ start:346 stop:501 length:156 start_codon:yes stop_codon:yes gene_type:complete